MNRDAWLEVIVTAMSPLLNEWCWTELIRLQSRKDWRTSRISVQHLKTHRECRTPSHWRAPQFVPTNLAFTLHPSSEHSGPTEVCAHRIFSSLWSPLTPPGNLPVLCGTVAGKQWDDTNKAQQIWSVLWIKRKHTNKK